MSLSANILLIWDRLGDYHFARKKALQSFWRSNIYTADMYASDQMYGWKKRKEQTHFYLSTQAEGIKDKNRLSNFIELIEKNDIKHIALAGYGKQDYRILAKEINKRKLKLSYFSESWYSANPIKEKLKTYYLKGNVKNLFVSGQRAKHYYSQKHGFKDKQIQTIYSVVDNTHFKRKKNSPDKRKTLLCVARFASEKNLKFLIECFLKSKLSETWSLKLIGGGPLKKELSIYKKDNVEIHPWLSYEELPLHYHKASAFILPSIFEPWGLVVNEAMAASLPILLSSEVGCLPDLLRGNGWEFDPYSAKSLTDILNKLTTFSREELEKKGKRSLEIINDYSCEIWAHQLLKSFGLDDGN